MDSAIDVDVVLDEIPARARLRGGGRLLQLQGGHVLLLQENC